LRSRRRVVDRAKGRRLDHATERARGSSLDRVASDAAARLQPSSPAPSEQAARIGSGAGRVQKKIKLEAQALRKAHPADQVEVWSQDEARFGLKPVLRRVWAPVGERPVGEVDERYEWLWLYAATHPRTGRVFWLVLPRLDAECVQAFLSAFAKEYAEEGKRILLVWDGAPAHRATTLKVPERISLLRVWPLVKEGVANRAHESLDELEQKVCSRCRKIKAEDVSARTKYHWWPEL
jgi:hypothetical protein